MKFASHSCSNQVTLPVIPLNQLLSGILMISILPNPVVDSLFSFYSTSQQRSVQRTTPSLLLASGKFPHSLSAAPTSLAALSRCHLQTPPQGWTFQSYSIPGSHWTIFCSSPTRAVQPRALIPSICRTLLHFSLSPWPFHWGSKLVYSTPFLAWILLPFSFFSFECSATRVFLPLLDFITLVN